MVKHNGIFHFPDEVQVKYNVRVKKNENQTISLSRTRKAHT